MYGRMSFCKKHITYTLEWDPFSRRRRLRKTLTRTSRWCLRDRTTSGEINSAAISATNIDLIFNMCAGASAIIFPCLTPLALVYFAAVSRSPVWHFFFVVFCFSKLSNLKLIGKCTGAIMLFCCLYVQLDLPQWPVAVAIAIVHTLITFYLWSSFWLLWTMVVELC